MSAVGIFQAHCSRCDARLIVSKPQLPKLIGPRVDPVRERGFAGLCGFCGSTARYKLTTVANREEAGRWKS